MPKKLSTKEHKVYLPGTSGPFRCDHCEYYIGKNSCNQENIIAFAKKGTFDLKMNHDLTAHVDPNGCSDYFERK